MALSFDGATLVGIDSEVKLTDEETKPELVWFHTGHKIQRSLPWTVLLIGGASGYGKTSVSYDVARHFGVGIPEVDDFQVILKKNDLTRAAACPPFLGYSPES